MVRIWVDSLIITISTILGLILIGGLIFVFLFLKSFKDILVLRYIIKGRKIIQKTKCKSFIDGEGVPFLRTLKKVAGRRYHPVPPSNAIETDNKGNRWIESYITETGEIHYIIDNGIEDDKISGFEPFTTKQRSILINQHKKALQRKGKNLMDLIIPIVYISAFMIIIIGLMVFWSDMAQPLLDMGDKVNANQQMQVTQAQILERMDKNIQVIGDQVGAEQLQEAPN